MNDTAAELICVATELFAKHGYEGTSIRMITDKADANLGAITYHFGSKEALYESVFGVMTEPFRPYMVEAVGTAGSPLDRLERFVRALFQYLRDHPTLPRLITQHLASHLTTPREPSALARIGPPHDGRERRAHCGAHRRGAAGRDNTGW